ncbi:porin [Escherichia coli]|uniref:porin n=1 Tax=Escherichia coli TaxID=562 RepID=UPI001114EF61
MLPSETMIWQPEFTDKTLSRKPGAVQNLRYNGFYVNGNYALFSMWWLYQFIPATSCMYCMTYMFLLTDRI